MEEPTIMTDPATAAPGAQPEYNRFEKMVKEQLDEFDQSLRQDSLQTISSPKVIEYLKRGKRAYLETVIRVATRELEELDRTPGESVSNTP